ncbi:sensor histidine kinase [Oleiagrimonas soli]|uniref:histidine kinase n=1 Tax=Oleiagrimonas soli TaxID=1543381 RepID=A0A099D021_9GAMM|nr:ATP-binding protein [Oleiagrimonas soli]KGI78600.1 histidine kinase [Oleiagrimonas soli]MBB6184108.1 nitrogen fixation/metabolism regulation signal transduction histidine kinase [Oleiagrimonas soli]
MRLKSLQGRMALLVGVATLTGALVYAGVTQWPLPQLIAAAAELMQSHVDVGWLRTPLGGLLITLLLLVPIAMWLGSRLTRPFLRLLRALEGAVVSYRDGDFGFSIATRRKDEIGDLIRMHNELGHTLREQRQHLVQRELLLDTVVQKTPVALILTDNHQYVTYANIAARQLFNEGKSLEGVRFDALLRSGSDALREIVESGRDALFPVEMDGAEETFHISQRAFRLQGRPHHLYLFRRMTRELSRQEVATWKRVIRVISHELNNSLAPISSLAHSGAELARRGDRERLPGVFSSISERAKHLHHFISGYADVAKLPTPRIEPVAWGAFIEALSLHCTFRLCGELPERDGRFDAGQVEQALINLVKNAHESGTDEDEVTLSIAEVGQAWRIEVADRGPGMSEAVLAQALLPFYSTKRSGTGLGLALAREITEAHGGRLSLSNRRHGGLRVTLLLPMNDA